MASQALYRKWRSQTFDEIIGQQHVTQTLTNALKSGRIAHAYLFAGPRGTGKTSTARLLAKAVNCQAEDLTTRPCNRCRICLAVTEGRLLDLIEIDAASNTGVDDIRDLREKVNFRPSEARIKFYIIDEVHMLSNSAFNALLKTLEEPPEHVIFVLATTEPEKIPSTITSRCQRFDFKRIKLDDIVQRLAHIVEQEGVKAEPAALAYIAQQGSGSMRDAISLLDQLTAYGSETITLNLVQSVLGAVASQSIMALLDALIERDVATGLDLINQIVSDGADPRQLAREIVEHLRSVMLVKLGDGAGLNLPDETLAALKTQAAKIDAPAIIRATTLFNNALLDIKTGLLTVPQLPLELAFVETATSAVGGAEPKMVDVEAVPSRSARTAPATQPAVTLAATRPGTGSIQEELTIETVRNCFESVLDDIEKKNKVMAEALRSQTRLYKVSGNEIFFVTVDMMKERFERPKPGAALNEAFTRTIGLPVIVRFLSEKNVSTPSDLAGEDSVDSDSAALLRAAEELGGKIIDSSN